MTFFLREDTASQEIPIGPLLDDDGVTPYTGAVANTDIFIWKTGATTLVNPSAGATHISGGVYYFVADATDSSTIGPARIFVRVTGTLQAVVACTVLDEAVYDALFGTVALATTGNLTSSTIGTVTTATTATNVTTVNGLAANVITATSIAADAITAAKIADGAIDANTFASAAITATAIATDALGAAEISAAAGAKLADIILRRAFTSAESSSDGDTATGVNVRNVLQALRALRNRVAVAAGTATIYKEDDTTAAWTSVITTAAGNPVSQSNPVDA